MKSYEHDDVIRPSVSDRRRMPALPGIAVATTLALWLLAPTPALAASAPSRQDVQDALERSVAAGIPGATAVIRGPGGVERYAAGVADLQRRVPLSPDHRARVGSVTKTFTAAAILKLVARGRVALDEPVERWLPGLVPNGERITVRQLLNHTSGLAEYCAVPPDSTLCVPPPSEMTRTWTPLQLVEIGVGAAPTFPPGQGFSYSNTDYVLLGMIIEQATGRSLTSSYKRMIFDPLGLKRTSLGKRSTIARPFAHGYDVLAGGNWPLDVTATSPTIAWGAGAIVSVPTDLQRFMRALLAGRLFPKSLLREMKIAAPGSLNGTPPSSPVEGGGVGTYGLGLIHFTWASACGVQGHSGSFPGFHTWAFGAKGGRRGAALYTTADVLPAGGVIAAQQAERTIACRMRFGDIGARKPRG